MTQTDKRFELVPNTNISYGLFDREKFEYIVKHLPISCESVVDVLNELHEENKQLKHKLDDWHQRTFKAHEYFNILEKVIDEVCNDDISNQIWKEYEKREKLIE